VLVAFVVTAGPSYLLDEKIGENLENLWVIAGALVAGGVIMWIVDARFARFSTARPEDMSVGQALGIGAAQILSAAFPGTSRSMVTIAAGQVGGMSRPAALEFSFFLSIPTMAAATGFKLLKGIFEQASFASDPGAPPHPWAILALGFVVSFVVALGVVAWFMRWVQRRGFVPFAIYRLALGAGVLVWAMCRK
jgi:undecaprenyl-diphosphatase